MTSGKMKIEVLLASVVWFAPLSRSFARERFWCLPAGRQQSEIVSAERLSDGTLKQQTLEQKLIELKARCRKGKLVDGKGKEIRFYHAETFGAPTAYAMETSHRQARELQELQKKYTIIQVGVDSSGRPRP